MNILFTKSQTVGSNFIRFLTESKVSHCGISGIKLHGTEMVLHASIGGVLLETRAFFEKDHKKVMEFKSTKTPSEQALSFAFSSLGEKYDYPSLLGFLPVIMGRWCGKKIMNPLATPSSVICSELIVRVFAFENQKRFGRLNPDNVVPEDVLRVCLQGIKTNDFEMI